MLHMSVNTVNNPPAKARCSFSQVKRYEGVYQLAGEEYSQTYFVSRDNIVLICSTRNGCFAQASDVTWSNSEFILSDDVVIFKVSNNPHK